MENPSSALPHHDIFSPLFAETMLVSHPSGCLESCRTTDHPTGRSLIL